MASSEPRDPRAERAREGVEDALGRLEERLDRASQAAERLLADAAQRATAPRGETGESGESGETGESGESGEFGKAGAADERPGMAPPAGWQQAAGDRDSAPPLLADADLLLVLFGALRDRIPPDLQQRLGEAIREVLLALRALIDWYLERSERTRRGPADIEDIPIL
jgi:hypothetical protein